MKVQSKIVILEANLNTNFSRIDYVGVCDDFATVQLGQKIPEYDILFIRDKEGSINVEFKKE